jgi:hypothetical protein
LLLSLFLVAGLAAAVGATWQWKNIQARQTRQSFDQHASGVAARIAKTLQRDTDLTTTSRALIEQNPDMTNAQLGSWFSTLEPSAPANASGVTYIEKVSSAQLYYYRVAISADPTSALSAGGSFTITPSTAQAPYCLTRLMAVRSALTSAADIALPPGLDWCSTSANGALTSARDTGQIEVTKLLGTDEGRLLGFQSQAGSAPGNTEIEALKSLNEAFSSTVVMVAPVYEGPTPATVAGRSSALEGWVGGVFDTGSLLASAVGTHSNLQVSLSRVNAGSRPEVVATSVGLGSTGKLLDAVPITADGHWIVTVRQPLVAGSATGGTKGLLLGGAIILATLILFAVLRSLVVTRRRAIDEAVEQTGELHHMSLHDPLTGLPNRTLVVDRAEQMLLRSRRSQLPTAA